MLTVFMDALMPSCHCNGMATSPPSRNHRSMDKLLSACVSGKIDVVSNLLVSKKLNLNESDSANRTALFYAIDGNHPLIVDLLLQNGADANKMSYAVFRIDSQLITNFEPPVVTASRLGSLEVIKLLCLYGANIHAQSEIRNASSVYKDASALHFACIFDREEIFHYLISNHIDVNLEDRSRETPLHKTLRCSASNCERKTKALKVLCEQGADVNHPSKVDCTPLYLATFYGCYKKIEMLLLYGAQVNKICPRENAYRTPLHIAAAKDRYQIAEMLISYGADLNVKNSLQCTPLQMNINLLSQSKIAQFLVYHGAALNGLDKWNLSIMASCIRNMRIDCESLAKLFVYAGYDLNQDTWLRRTDNGNSYECDDMLEIPIPEGRVRKLCDWLQERQTNPLGLKHLCRITIRNALRNVLDNTSIVDRIRLLPLPSQIIDFILLEDLLI